VTLQETTFTRTIRRNQRLQTKTPEKEHVNMARQAECESCFQANVLIFTFIFRCSGQRPVPSVRGGFGGLSPSNKARSPPKWKYETL